MTDMQLPYSYQGVIKLCNKDTFIKKELSKINEFFISCIKSEPDF